MFRVRNAVWQVYASLITEPTKWVQYKTNIKHIPVLRGQALAIENGSWNINLNGSKIILTKRERKLIKKGVDIYRKPMVESTLESVEKLLTASKVLNTTQLHNIDTWIEMEHDWVQTLNTN